MIILDIRLGRFEVLLQRESNWVPFGVERVGPGDIIIHMPYASPSLCNTARFKTTSASL